MANKKMKSIMPQIDDDAEKLSRKERKILSFFASILIDILGDDILEKYNQKHGNLEDDK